MIHYINASSHLRDDWSVVTEKIMIGPFPCLRRYDSTNSKYHMVWPVNGCKKEVLSTRKWAALQLVEDCPI